ncbi:MAG: DMT family transporter [Deltaproteobacteria bacterium]|nr:DMT family transporter [Deltaproteobacteria bacterium]
MPYALVFGLLLPFVVRMNESLSRAIGHLPASFAVHAVGAIFGAIAFLPLSGGTWWQAARGAPWWAWFGGVVGSGMVILANRAVGAMGIASFTALTVAIQLVSSAAIDHFGWVGSPVHPMSLLRAAGIVLLALGATLVVRG